MTHIKVRMLRTERGSETGVHVATFEAGQTYEIAASLAQVFLREGWAVAADVPPVEEVKVGDRPATADSDLVKPRAGGRKR